MTALLQNKKVILGVTGSIAAYKSAELIRLFTKQGFSVKAVMTEAAQRFITPLTLQTLSQHPVYCDQWDAEIENPMLHIELARWADLVLIAPASADFIARLTYGHANDLLTNLCLASATPIFIAPAMNQQMWSNPVTQNNIQQLLTRNINVLEPESGSQACGEIGPGRMLEPEKIASYFQSSFSSTHLQDRKILITAGPTQEAIDPVRYLSNNSSAKMGYCLAQAFKQSGAKVSLISGPSSITPPIVDQFITVKTAMEMYEATMSLIHNCDIFVGAAAVADYRPENFSSTKIKKSSDCLTLNLIKNPDILSAVTVLENKPLTVGFAAETNNLLDYATQKLINKNADMIIANPVRDDVAFYADDNEIYIIQKNKEILHFPKMPKSLLAQKICDVIAAAFQGKELPEFVP